MTRTPAQLKAEIAAMPPRWQEAFGLIIDMVLRHDRDEQDSFYAWYLAEMAATDSPDAVMAQVIEILGARS